MIKKLGKMTLAICRLKKSGLWPSIRGNADFKTGINKFGKDGIVEKKKPGVLHR